MGRIATDMSGHRFGKLVVASRGENKDNGRQVAWNCKCDCGNLVTVRGDKLRSGRIKSCGCSTYEQLVERNTTHGKSKGRLYAVWRSMKRRCFSPNDHRYRNYGGRGIKVCDEWRDDFQSFYDWAMANGYDESAPRGQCTIDRIDNDGNYCPENCRWITIQDQQATRRKPNEQRTGPDRGHGQGDVGAD